MESLKPQGEYFDYIDIDAIDNKSHKISAVKHLLVKEAPSRASRRLENGSVLFSFVRPYLENVAFVDENFSHCIASTGFYICNSNGILNPNFMFVLMTSKYVIDGLNSFMKGDNSPSIKKEEIENFLYPIPPISEQRRIIDRINSVFPIIENLAVQKSNLQKESISIKSKILDLAIRGKLVPQDPNDEPASVLLERIRAEKEELIKQGKIKRDKKESVIFKGDDNSYYEKIGDEITCIDDELPFEIPDSWCWARLSSLTSQIFAGGDKPVNYSKEKTEFYPIPIYSNGVENDGLYGYTDIPRVSERSLTISARGTIGFACVRTEPFVPIIRLLTIIPIKGIDVEFLKLIFQFFIESGKGSSIPQLTVPEVKPKLIPVPSIEEQRKIAQAINNLFVLIESIKASLS